MRPASQNAASRGLLDDLPLFALTQHACTAAAVLLAKAATLWHTYPRDPVLNTLGRLPTILAYDLLMLAAAAAPIVLSVHLRLPVSRFLRPFVALVLYLFFFIWMVLSLANASFLVTVGSALNRDWLSLAPSLGAYLLNTATLDSIQIVVAVLAICLLPLVLTPGLVGVLRGRIRPLSWAWGLGLLVCGLVCLRQPPGSPEEITMRHMTVAEVLFAGAEATHLEAPPLTHRQTDLLAGLEGGPSDDGRRAFSSLVPRPYNVVLVVWESVGERYLKTNALGDAATPNLDLLSSRGSVRFRQAYSQSPLSVQSVWTFFTGRNPPAKAWIFLDPDAMPPHGPTLPQVLKNQDYGTCVLIGSYTHSWGADRIVGFGGVDLFEDIETLANRDRYKQVGWSIDGGAINDRFWTWLEGQPRGKPFFSVLWNVETHFPYRWAQMSGDDEAQDKAVRYRRVIEQADRLLGDIASGLRTRGLEKDTLIVVVGDHGEGMERPPHPTQRLHGSAVFEDTIHVPLVFLQPALGKAHMVDTPVVLADVYPTVLDLVGARWPDGLDGVSLARTMSPRSLIMRGMQWWPAAIRSGPYKLMLTNPRDRGLLYQVENDPLEGEDLSDREPEIALAMRSRLMFETAQRGRTDPSVDSEWRQPWNPFSRPGFGERRRSGTK